MIVEMPQSPVDVEVASPLQLCVLPGHNPSGMQVYWISVVGWVVARNDHRRLSGMQWCLLRPLDDLRDANEIVSRVREGLLPMSEVTTCCVGPMATVGEAVETVPEMHRRLRR